ncbi:MAG: hypothetical protein AAB865_01455 [Patescibacteria group bacterium]
MRKRLLIFFLLASSLLPIVAYAADDDKLIPAPNLSIPIPGLSFSAALDDGNYLTADFIGEYISGIYRYALGVAAILAVVMIMVGGVQYILGSASGGEAVAAAKKRITNGITGLVLLLSTYALLSVINPDLTFLRSIKIQTIDQIRLSLDTQGPEGSGGACGSGTWESLPAPYRDIVQAAKNDPAVACAIPDGIMSPTGGSLPNCSNHHWFDAETTRATGGDYKKIKKLDWAAPWGSAILSPFAGTVTYQEQSVTDTNLCGNRITIKSSDGEGAVVICHAKDFMNGSGEFVNGAQVAQGDVIGHVGGVCCSGQPERSGWITQCATGGTMCDHPDQNQDCSCQPIHMAGNTTGPHVHMSFYYGGNILSCLQ